MIYASTSLPLNAFFGGKELNFCSIFIKFGLFDKTKLVAYKQFFLELMPVIQMSHFVDKNKLGKIMMYHLLGMKTMEKSRYLIDCAMNICYIAFLGKIFRRLIV